MGRVATNRRRFSNLLAFLDDDEYTALQASAEFELGKLTQATKQYDEALRRFERVLAVLDGFPEACYHRQASERPARLGSPAQSPIRTEAARLRRIAHRRE